MRRRNYRYMFFATNIHVGMILFRKSDCVMVVPTFGKGCVVLGPLCKIILFSALVIVSGLVFGLIVGFLKAISCKFMR